MKTIIKSYLLSIILSLSIIAGMTVNAFAALFNNIPYSFESYSCAGLDWCDSDDDYNSGSTSLGFSVNIGGASYDYFDMDSNGYVEMLQGFSDTPTNYSYGGISGLIADDNSSTYLLAAYDDLSSYDYEYYGYKLFADRAVFYYWTETYYDEGDDLTNLFQIILNDNGNVRWNFSSANFSDYDYDLFSGLYFGNTGTLLELARDDIPQYKSYLYTSVAPEPISSTLFIVGGATLGFRSFRKKRKK